MGPSIPSLVVVAVAIVVVNVCVGVVATGTDAVDVCICCEYLSGIKAPRTAEIQLY